MQLTNSDKKYYTRRLLESRLRLLCNQGFYGTLLMHMDFSLDETIKNVAVSKNKISFQPEFLETLSDREVDLVLLHEVIHISLRHNLRKKNFEDKELFDKVADIVVNSNILKSYDMNLEAITLNGKVLEHTDLNNKEGYEYSVEELYGYMYQEYANAGKVRNVQNEDGSYSIKTDINNNFDDHSRWDKESEEDELADKEWEQYNLDACEMMLIKDPNNSRGLIPGYALRKFKELRNPKTDWRTLLNNFIQDEVNDYSFTPPDKRYDDSDFFLPDYNDLDEKVKNVLFMIDTSGSMSDDQITECYSEVKGAIDQFGGKLKGWLGFFDAAIVEPKEFDDEESLKIIKPYGGGGTDFSIIFKYIEDKMSDKEISSCIILTDGYAPFPKESNIPTIWIINNDAVTPPWGKVARLK